MRTHLPLTILLSCAAPPALAQENYGQSPYERHVVFDNARSEGGYYYGKGSAIGPSELELIKGMAPIEQSTVHSPPNALRIRYTSREGGDWRVSIDAKKERGLVDWAGDSLKFWIYSEDEIDEISSPRILLYDLAGGESTTINLIGKRSRLRAKTWTEITLPFEAFGGLFNGTTDPTFDPRRIGRILILQGLDDGRPHTLYIDDIRIVDAASRDRTAPPRPAALTARGYERHVELSWRASPAADTESYRIYRSTGGRRFVPVATQRVNVTRFMDWVGAPGQSLRYKVAAVDSAGNESPLSTEARAATRTMTDDELMTMVQEAQFKYYWDGANPQSGMAIEVMPGDPNQIALGASGFGVMAILVGIDRGFVTREEGVARMLRITRFLDKADRFHGMWPHFIDARTGKTMAYFGKYDDGGDLIETAFMIQGLLAARQYFTGDTPGERELRDTITRFWRTIEWDWYRKTPDSDFLYWHWSPNHGFHINHPLIGWNESAIAYLLAIASPTHGVPASMWHSGWAGTSPTAVTYRRNWSRTTKGDHFVNGNSYYGIKLEVGEGNGAELFFAQFSFLGFDPRGIRDKYTNYFKNNRNIGLISQAYAIDNPEKHVGYGADAWGQSAGIKSGGGRARPADDNGTLVVHASLGMMPFTPEASMKALRHYYRDLGAKTWGVYGFVDSFNQSENWHDEVYMGLNQAQTVVMIENHRTGLPWKLFMANPEIQPALSRIGFTKDPAP